MESWPRGEAVALHPRLQALTLEIILRAVFGLDPGSRLDALRERLTAILEWGSRPIGMLQPLQRVSTAAARTRLRPRSGTKSTRCCSS